MNGRKPGFQLEDGSPDLMAANMENAGAPIDAY